MLVDHRDDLVRERTGYVNRLRWHLHELDPTWDPTPRSLNARKNLDALAEGLATMAGTVARIALDLVRRVADLTITVNDLEREIKGLVADQAPTLLAVPGVGALTAAKIVAETADVRRFRSKDAFARHNGTAPLPVWSSNKENHRLSRTGNRQLNAAIHRIAITQLRCHPDAQAYMARRLQQPRSTKKRELRALKRRLSDIVYRALLADAPAPQACLAEAA